jgi:exodeoxyribonuclease-3
MRILSWNVNGLRAVSREGAFKKWVASTEADIVCVQETKMAHEDIACMVAAPAPYTCVWQSAQKRGYSGVAAFVRRPPLAVHAMGIPEFDDEGRVQALEYESFVLINSYWPNSRQDASRMDYKVRFADAFVPFCNRFRDNGKHVIVCGDYNIAHEEIDLARPAQNVNNAGFRPDERTAMTRFIEAGYVDAFRHFTKEGGHYTWWSYMFKAREKNIGWRIDYFCVNAALLPRVKEATILPEVRGSDHCPVSLVVHI